MKLLQALAWILGGIAITWLGLLLAIAIGPSSGVAISVISIVGGIVCVNIGLATW